MTPDEWTRIKAVALDAAALSVADRQPFITQACAGDANLLREVTSLVDAMAAAGDGLEPPIHPFDDGFPNASLSGRVGAYEIISLVGAGGMGEVYRARDTRLDRTVAIKVLPARACGDPISRQRMAREARAVAALNHPHICTIHDVGVHDGRDFLVMEYLNGETLASRLSRGPLPLPDAIRIADQMASALEEAHRAGTIHRDVKPANIMLVAERPGAEAVHAKLLDFGVAKAGRRDLATATGSPSESGLSDSTEFEYIPGTLHYMAPEVTEGHASDARADMFALGAVLFEMITGRRAFEGSTRDEVLDAVSRAHVANPSSLRSGSPAALDRIVSRCLARDPAARYPSMRELREALQVVERRLRGSMARVLAMAAALTVLIAGTAAWTVWGRAPPDAIEPTIIRLPASAGVQGAPSLSPDGSSLVFQSMDGTLDNPELVLLQIGSNETVRLTTDAGVEEWPIWSPDGRTIAFIRCGGGRCGIFTLPVGGGPERRLRDLRDDRYFCLVWAPDGRSLLFAERASKLQPYVLFELTIDTLAVRQLTSPSGEGEFRFALSRDGRTVALIRLATDGVSVLLLAIDTGDVQTLLSRQQEWFGGVAWSADGRHLILSANQQGVRRLWRLPASGGPLEPITIAGEDAYFPSMSADGRRLIFVREFRDWDMAKIERSPGRTTPAAPFASSARIDLDPAFSPDGRKLAFVSERSGTRELWVSDADGSRAVQLTSRNGIAAGRPSWSLDSQHLAFQGAGIIVSPATGGDERMLAPDGEYPSWSADGRWIYFTRTRGIPHIVKVPREGGTPVLVVDGGVTAARESPDGVHLYFVKAPGGIWRRRVAGGEATPVVEDFAWALPGYWALTREGIYYTVREQRDRTLVHHLRFFDLAAWRSSDLGPLPGTLDPWVGSLTLSPDQRTIVYTQRTYQSSEVVMIEPFR